MRKDDSEKAHIERLEKLIEELRRILNEIFTTSDCIEDSEEILIVSKCLDELIVEYMIISNRKILNYKHKI